MSRHRTQGPREYRAEFNDISSEVLNSFSAGGPAAAPRAAGSGGPDMNTVLSFMKYKTETEAILGDIERELDDKTRDNAEMAKEADRVGRLVETLEASVAGLKDEVTKLNEAHVKELGDAKTEAATEKVELEGKLATQKTEIETLTTKLAEMDGDIQKLTGQVTELTTANETLTTANTELEARVVKLGGQKKAGLAAVPPADKQSTAKGDEIQPTKALSLKEAAVEARQGAEGGDAEDGEMAQLVAVYGEYCQFAAVQNRVAGRTSTGPEERELRKFLSEPREGCEACAADPEHHVQLARTAIFRRTEILQYAATA